MLRKSKLTLILFLLLLIVLFTISTYELQQLVNKGTVIADKQCLLINPLIIERKNSFIKSMQIMKADGSAEEYWNESKHYIEVTNKYVKAQQQWLDEDRELMDRWEYKFFVPPKIKELSQLQYVSREADMKSSIAVVDMFNNRDKPEMLNRLASVVAEETKKVNDADAKFNKVRKIKGQFDPRARFIKVPASKCPSANWNIPNVMDFILPPKPIQNGPLSHKQ